MLLQYTGYMYGLMGSKIMHYLQLELLVAMVVE